MEPISNRDPGDETPERVDEKAVREERRADGAYQASWTGVLSDLWKQLDEKRRLITTLDSTLGYTEERLRDARAVARSAEAKLHDQIIRAEDYKARWERTQADLDRLGEHAREQLRQTQVYEDMVQALCDRFGVTTVTAQADGTFEVTIAHREVLAVPDA